jgi:hypothetical protein
VTTSNLINLTFTDFADFTTDFPENDGTQSNSFLPPFFIDFAMPIRGSKDSFNISFNLCSTE